MSDNEPTITGIGAVPVDSEIGRMLTQVLGGAGLNMGGMSGRRAAPTGEAALEALSARCRAYIESFGVNESESCPYRVGQFVTPRKGVALKGIGDPHVVLETRAATSDFRAESGSDASSNTYGARRDIRVTCFSSGVLVTHWMESYELEAFTAGPAPTAE